MLCNLLVPVNGIACTHPQLCLVQLTAIHSCYISQISLETMLLILNLNVILDITLQVLLIPNITVNQAVTYTTYHMFFFLLAKFIQA